MIKKLLVLSMAAIMAMVTLAGCGSDSNDTPANPPTTTTTLPAGTQVTAANTTPFDAKTTTNPFYVSPKSTFEYSINNFAAGNKIVFDAGSSIDVVNTSATDGIVLVTGQVGGNKATIKLSVAVADDAKIFGSESFNTVFGAGSLK